MADTLASTLHTYTAFFFLPCITEEENFIISPTFIFTLYFECFVIEWLRAFCICCLYYPYFNRVRLHSANFYQYTNLSVSQIKPWEMKDIFGASKLKFKIEISLCIKEDTGLLRPFFHCYTYMNEIFKVAKYKTSLKIYIKLWTEHRIKREEFCRFWIALDIHYS